MRNGTFYLNNTGSRWVILENGHRPRHTFTTESGQQVTRTAIFYESFGNFATVCINWKGKRIKVFLDSLLPDRQEEVNQIHFNQFKKASK